MRRIWVRVLMSIAGGVFVLAGGTVSYLYARKPAMTQPAAIEVAMTPERIERGRYIFTVADCDGCHSERDFSRFGGPAIAAGRGKGNVIPEAGLPGTVVAPNITPDQETGIGNWTDGEKIRAIREGIGRDGLALFPMMGYERFRHMSDEDVESLVAYLNTLKPVRNLLPRTKLNFPVNLLIKGAPQPVGSVPPVDRRNVARYGEYLATLGGCVECHTAEKGPRFAGGREFAFGPQTKVVSANITPDADTGIGRWTAENFVDRFHQYRGFVTKGSPQVGPADFTLMPWLNLAQLPAEDLKAIYTFLRSQAAVSNIVDTHPLGLVAQAR